jgi:hypothetical protein
MLFHYNGKESRLQELCEFTESVNILSSTSVHINREFSKSTTSMCNQADKENSRYENFHNTNVAASNVISFQCQGRPITAV